MKDVGKIAIVASVVSGLSVCVAGWSLLSVQGQSERLHNLKITLDSHIVDDAENQSFNDVTTQNVVSTGDEETSKQRQHVRKLEKFSLTAFSVFLTEFDQRAATDADLMIAIGQLSEVVRTGSQTDLPKVMEKLQEAAERMAERKQSFAGLADEVQALLGRLESPK